VGRRRRTNTNATAPAARNDVTHGEFGMCDVRPREFTVVAVRTGIGSRALCSPFISSCCSLYSAILYSTASTMAALASDDADCGSAPAAASAGSVAAGAKRAARNGDPFGYLREYHTDTHALSSKLGDVAIREPEYTPEEKAQMEELRNTVAGMMRDPSKMVCTADDYPGGMHQHWTTYWPQGKDYPMFVDTVSAADADPTTWPEHELIRFLRARETMKKSVKMYFNYRRWRLVYGTSHLASFPTMPYEPLIQSILSHSYHKLDKHGRPLYLQRSGLIDPHRFATEVSLEKIGIGHTWFVEEMTKRREVGSKLTGKRVMEITNIIDIAGVGLAARKMLKIFATTSYIDQHFYPEVESTVDNCVSSMLATCTVAQLRRILHDSSCFFILWVLSTSSMRPASFPCCTPSARASFPRKPKRR
jgi:hypothetical protein